jgi:catechol 2,3-dioxygenase-like lactoylglutathione lyase family enzyme
VSAPALEVTAVDHIYVAVSDLDRAAAFYDPVMELLGFKKGTKPIAGEPHVHYYNRVTQYTLRPARAGGSAEPYRVGGLHHLCFRVASRDAVDQAHRRLCAAGVAASEPRFYDYRPDYYATLFEDPDGIRLEIVADSELRRTVRERWDELDGFVDPVARLADRSPGPVTAGNLRNAIPDELPDELVTLLCSAPGVRVERIVSRGHASAAGFWYDQDQRELVVVIDGAARLAFDDQPPVELAAGDWLILEPHRRHRVDWTAPDRDTIWLAVFL